MRFALCDDNKNELTLIQRAILESIEKTGCTCRIQLFTNAYALIQEQKNNAFDAVFLDIDMPEMSGMDAAEQIHQLGEDTEIVFVTNHDELVYKAYRFKALGFLRKKHLSDEMDEILEILTGAIRRKTKHLNFHDNGKLLRIRLDDIVYIQSDDHYAEVVTINGKETIRESLNSIAEQYESYGFIRVHMRYLVNYKYIYSIERTTVILHDRKQLPLSRSKANSVKEKMQLYARRI